MDVSFCSSAGPPRNILRADRKRDQGVSPLTQRANACEKTPIPARVADLVKIASSEEKFRIGSYSFGTVKVIGIVKHVEVALGQTCTTYELIDPAMKNSKTPAALTVIRYESVDLRAPKEQTLRIGMYMQAVGKLRFFDNRLSLVSFTIGEVDSMEIIELHPIESKLAYLYYSKNIPEQSMHVSSGVNEVPLFACDLPSDVGISPTIAPTPKAGPTGPKIAQGPKTAQARVGGGDADIRSFCQPADRSLINQKPKPNPHQDRNNNMLNRQDTAGANNAVFEEDLARDRGLVGQQAKIYEFIRRNGVGEEGVSLKQILAAIGSDANAVIIDVGELIRKSVLYSTIDEDHFATIDD